MNLADYLSELLGQNEEVSIPGLGYFVRERVNGFYSDTDARFYPPYHRVKFVAAPKDDETFTQYVADKKNISIASAKYFAEKFVGTVKEQSATGKYLFADLGLFYTEQGQLMFKANDKVADDPSFYGYPPVNIYKLSGGNTKPLPQEPVTLPVLPTTPVQTIEQQQYYEEEPERKRGINIWLIILITITVLGLAVFGVYKFYPALFNKYGKTYTAQNKKDDTIAPAKQQAIKTDTETKAATPTDTLLQKDTSSALKASTAPVKAADTVKAARFEVVLHDGYKKFTDASAEVKYFLSKGVQAKVLPLSDIPGPLYKISFKTCNSQSEATQAMLDLVNAGKINKDLKIEKVNPK